MESRDDPGLGRKPLRSSSAASLALRRRPDAPDHCRKGRGVEACADPQPRRVVNSVVVICRGILLTRADANAPAVRAERARDLERDLPLRLIRPAA